VRPATISSCWTAADRSAAHSPDVVQGTACAAVVPRRLAEIRAAETDFQQRMMSPPNGAVPTIRRPCEKHSPDLGPASNQPGIRGKEPFKSSAQFFRRKPETHRKPRFSASGDWRPSGYAGSRSACWRYARIGPGRKRAAGRRSPPEEVCRQRKMPRADARNNFRRPIADG